MENRLFGCGKAASSQVRLQLEAGRAASASLGPIAMIIHNGGNHCASSAMASSSAGNLSVILDEEARQIWRG